jgi:hypothetical protein
VGGKVLLTMVPFCGTPYIITASTLLLKSTGLEMLDIQIQTLFWYHIEVLDITSKSNDFLAKSQRTRRSCITYGMRLYGM